MHPTRKRCARIFSDGHVNHVGRLLPSSQKKEIELYLHILRYVNVLSIEATSPYSKQRILLHLVDQTDILYNSWMHMRRHSLIRL